MMGLLLGKRKEEMKTVQDIDNLIEECKMTLRAGNKSLRRATKTRLFNEIDYLRGVRAYLESEPSEAFLLGQKKRLENQIVSIDSMFEFWRTTYNGDGDARKVFEQETGLPHLRRNLKKLKFILEK